MQPQLAATTKQTNARNTISLPIPSPPANNLTMTAQTLTVVSVLAVLALEPPFFGFSKKSLPPSLGSNA